MFCHLSLLRPNLVNFPNLCHSHNNISVKVKLQQPHLMCELPVEYISIKLKCFPTTVIDLKGAGVKPIFSFPSIQ